MMQVLICKTPDNISNNVPNMEQVDSTPNLLPELFRLIIIKHTPPCDWHSTVRVCQRWHKLVPEACVQFSLALHAAKRITSKMNECCIDKSSLDQFNINTQIYDLVKIEAFWNTAEAEAYASQMPDDGPDDVQKDKAFSAIVKHKAAKDLQGATAIAEQIKEPWVKAEAYLHIAKVDPAFISKAKKTFTKDEAFLEIVKVEVLKDPSEAEKTAQQINDQRFLIEALIEIAKVVEGSDLEELKLAIIDSSMSPMLKVRDLMKLFKLGLQSAMDSALQIISQFAGNPRHTPTMLRDIANADPQHDFSASKIAAKQIPDDYEKKVALIQIAIDEAKYDFKKGLDALKLLQSQNSDVGRFNILDQALGSLAVMKAQSAPFEASWIARMIKNDFQRAKALIHLGTIFPKDELSEAKSLIPHFKDPWEKACLLTLIAKVFSSRAEGPL